MDLDKIVWESFSNTDLKNLLVELIDEYANAS